MHVNVATRTVTFKLVYYGPGWGGKTTNLEEIHKRAPVERRGKLLSVSTQGDRTLFFDCMPVELGHIDGLTTKFQLYTVPGQAYYAATRKLVLRGVDGVVFVADSDPERLEENRTSLQELETFVREQEGVELVRELPLVLQWNKQDLPGALGPLRLAAELNESAVPAVACVAREGIGVLLTLRTLVQRVLERYAAEIAAATGSRRCPLQDPAGQAPPTVLDDVASETRFEPSQSLDVLDVCSSSAESGPLPRTPEPAVPESYDPIDDVVGTQVPRPEPPCPWSRAAASAPQDDGDPVIGRQIRGCRIHTKLAVGGMGAVYLARHHVLQKDVVVKVLKPGSNEHPRRVQRFLREARLAASVEHNNVVAVQDVGTSESGLHYILMQYVAGENLRQRIVARGAHDPDEATRITLAVAQALRCMHDAGIIHRDIKAENVVITPADEVKLIDFGLAKDLSDEGGLTLPGALVGTPAYIAPEIGRVDRIDGRVDIYSLGLTFYFLLTGRPPFEGQAVEDVLARKVRLEAPERYAPGLSERHRRVLATMLAFDRERRYPDAGALAADLEALLDGGALSAPPLPDSNNDAAVAPDPNPESRASGASAPGARALTPGSLLREEVRAAVEEGRGLLGGRYQVLSEFDPQADLHLSRAWDTKDEALTALRVFRHFDRLESAARRDIAQGARLRHPYLLPVRRTRVAEGCLLVAMAPVEGQTLQSLCDPRHPLQHEEVVRVVRDVALGLAVAHEAGLVHGAIQPASILVGTNGRGILLDLGLGSVVRRAVRGLPVSACLPPGGAVDAAGDLYSLGAVLYAALTGRWARPGARPPSAYVPGLPPELDRICMSCLGDPCERPASARELASELDALQGGVTPPSGRSRVGTWALPTRRNEYTLFAALALVIAMGLGLLSAMRRADLAAQQAARYEAMLLQLEAQQSGQNK